MTKTRTILSVALLMAAVIAQAIPAHRKPVTVKQPDGTEVTICLKGDEWQHFTTTTDGYTVVQNDAGYYVYAQKEGGRLKATRMVAHDADVRQPEERTFLQKVQKRLMPDMDPAVSEMRQRTMAREQQKQQKAMTQRAAAYDYNKFKGLIILIEYNNKKFSRSDYKDLLNDMVNQEDYTGYGNEAYTGSVRDYFSDNSGGRFKPQFDIAGPYTVNYSQYSGNNNYMNIINAALDAADKDVNFKDYDGDGDGVVDMVYFIVAGNGSNYSGNNSGLWWPHRSNIYNPKYYTYVTKDGVTLWDYASSTELAGFTSAPNTVKIDGIGTICHEFSHVLGLPDFYDTDYEGSGGESNHPDGWSVMAGGSYNNDSRTPVGYSLYERYAVGFMDELPTITKKGDYTLEPLFDCQSGYRLNTPVANEFFVLENRQKNQFKWDAYLPGSGMLVHRVDLTSQSVWNNNTINNNPSHNYYELLRADGSHKSGGIYVDSPADAFPGTKNVTELTNTTSPASLKSWRGEENEFGLTNIRQTSGGDIVFTVKDNHPLDEYGTEEFKELPVGTEALLRLDQAQVVFVYTKNGVTTAYLRDASGAIALYNTGMELEVGQVLTGTVYAQREEVNGVWQASSDGSAPDSEQMSIAEGGEVLPREVTFEELSADHYSDLVVVKGVHLMKDIKRRAYMYSAQDSSNRIRIWDGNFDISPDVPNEVDGKCFDVTGIYGTYTDGINVYNELNVTKAVEDKTNTMTAIHDVRSDEQSHAPAYNLSGQKVGNAYKGLVVKDGKKRLMK